MGVEINDQGMRSTTSGHTATRLTSGGWVLSWLPGRVLTRSQAVAGIRLADTTGEGLEPGDSRWPALDAWARELDLSGPEAVVRVSTSDEVRQRIAHGEEVQERAEQLYRRHERCANEVRDAMRSGDQQAVREAQAELRRSQNELSTHLTAHRFEVSAAELPWLRYWQNPTYRQQRTELAGWPQLRDSTAVHAESQAQAQADVDVEGEAAAALSRIEAKLAPGCRTRINGVVQAHQVRQELERQIYATPDDQARARLGDLVARAQHLATDLTQAALRDGTDPDVVSFALNLNNARVHGADATGPTPARVLADTAAVAAATLPADTDGHASDSASDSGTDGAVDRDADRRAEDVVIACGDCELEFDDQHDRGEAAYLAGVHNDLHHGGRPSAVVVPVDEATSPADQAATPATPDLHDAAQRSRLAELTARAEAARADAVAMTGPVETSDAGRAWSERVDAAVFGLDAADPAELDRWMQRHAESSQPHVKEAELVAAWETHRATTTGSESAEDATGHGSEDNPEFQAQRESHAERERRLGWYRQLQWQEQLERDRQADRSSGQAWDRQLSQHELTALAIDEADHGAEIGVDVGAD